MIRHFRRLLALVRTVISTRVQRPDPPVIIDVQDHWRKHAIRESEFQAAADSQAKILRVSGKVPPATRRIPGVTVTVRVKSDATEIP